MDTAIGAKVDKAKDRQDRLFRNSKEVYQFFEKQLGPQDAAAAAYQNGDDVNAEMYRAIDYRRRSLDGGNSEASKREGELALIKELLVKGDRWPASMHVINSSTTEKELLKIMPEVKLLILARKGQ